jgi:predicted O-methyltransferase YrrM
MALSLDKFADYSLIFNNRGLEYDQAISQSPTAMQEEFEFLLDMAALQKGESVLEIAAAGGYMAQYLSKKTSNTPLQTLVPFFTRNCRRG